MRVILKLTAVALLVALTGVAVYEAVALWQARRDTPDIIGAALAAPMPLTLADLGRRRQELLLAIEDPGFFQHNGVDFASPGQGMTTITQALVKRYYFHPFEPGFAKLEQSLIARFALHPYASKEQQLLLFLNHAYFGHRDGREIEGFAAAAHSFHGKPFAALSEDEFISLTARLIAPNGVDPLRHPAAHQERLGRIHRLLAGQCRPTGVFDPWYEGCAQR